MDIRAELEVKRKGGEVVLASLPTGVDREGSGGGISAGIVLIFEQGSLGFERRVSL